MDRRQQKTRKAIFSALSNLLEQKRFECITVQEIIDEADIGRSTFYAHFETKDDLLKEMCTDIFHHIFAERLPQEADSDHMEGSANLELKLGHILYHLKENKCNLKGILEGESGELFLYFLKGYLCDLFIRYKDDFPCDIPEDFLLHHLAASFSEAVKWWMREDTRHSPEEVAAYYMAMIRTQNRK
ncbi:MAG: TetR/AcrR family transcriptional regulator [Oscillospiraceae bacterium]|nr:TetR/AcrR family transcriptional regulator [Oscillospiraceae bacterium]